MIHLRFGHPLHLTVEATVCINARFQFGMHSSELTALEPRMTSADLYAAAVPGKTITLARYGRLAQGTSRPVQAAPPVQRWCSRTKALSCLLLLSRTGPMSSSSRQTAHRNTRQSTNADQLFIIVPNQKVHRFERCSL
jgi:hypothetical protein